MTLSLSAAMSPGAVKRPTGAGAVSAVPPAAPEFDAARERYSMGRMYAEYDKIYRALLEKNSADELGS